jgi:hypothetical protein
VNIFDEKQLRVSKHVRRFPYTLGADEFAFEYYRENVSWEIYNPEAQIFGN